MFRVLTLGLSVMLMGTARGENWPQWRGPNGNGSSMTADPPVHWGPEQNIKWQLELPGQGASTPIVWDDKVFILTAIKTDRKGPADQDTGQSFNLANLLGTGLKSHPDHYHRFVVLCYARETGSEKWRSIAAEAIPHESGHITNTFASYSPVTDGEFLYVSFGTHGVFCFDLQGNQIWETKLGKMETQLGYGEGSSPALFEDTLVVPFDHEGQSYYFALDAKTGQQRWKVAREEMSTWATPAIVSHNGRQQVIANGVIVRSYDLSDGSLLWQCRGQAQSPIPSPIIHDGIAYCMTGFLGNAVYAISLDARGNVYDTEYVRWKRHDAAPYVASAVLYKNLLYYTKSDGNILTSVNATTGETIFEKQRIRGIRKVHASLVAAADRIYVTGRNGTTVVLKHSDEYEILATNRLNETFDASPAIVDNEMYLRGSKHLYCIANE